MGSPPTKMESGPSKMMETVIGILIPSACREEVMGDLHERGRCPRRYVIEAARTVPMVILSRIRRTTAVRMLLLETYVLYLSFVIAARTSRNAWLLSEPYGYLRLALPVVAALLVLTLVDAYVSPGRRVVLGVASAFCAILFQSWLLSANPKLALPPSLMFLGACGSVPFLLLIRTLFGPGNHRTTGAG